MTEYQDLIYRLHKRAEIRRSIQNRKSVQEGCEDRLANLLDEAGVALQTLIDEVSQLKRILQESSTV